MCWHQLELRLTDCKKKVGEKGWDYGHTAEENMCSSDLDSHHVLTPFMKG